MSLIGDALRVTVFIGEGDRYRRRPLYKEIVRRAQEAALAGATVLHGCEGFGTTSLVHTTRILSLAEDLPIVVVIVDAADKVRAFLPQLEKLVTEGLILLDEVQVLRYVAAPESTDPDTTATGPATDLRSPGDADCGHRGTF